MNIEEIVIRLVGDIQPLGDHNIDQQRLQNLKTLNDLVEELLSRIISVAHEANRQEASIRNIGKCAKEFLLDITERLRENGYGDS